MIASGDTIFAKICRKDGKNFGRQAWTMGLLIIKYPEGGKIMDELFKDTNKTIDRKSNEIQFFQNGEILTPYQLSSGEKQMLVIMLTVLVENGEHYALLMDEPEISLHIEWQKGLLNLIRELNPNVQIILSTHSPALIMDGWMDIVTEVEDVTVR